MVNQNILVSKGKVIHVRVVSEFGSSLDFKNGVVREQYRRCAGNSTLILMLDYLFSLGLEVGNLNYASYKVMCGFTVWLRLRLQLLNIKFLTLLKKEKKLEKKVEYACKVNIFLFISND